MLPEEKARVKIDKQLRNAGWDIVAWNEYLPNSTYGSHIVEAHHIDYFVSSLNNDASNQLIVCPNHHSIRVKDGWIWLEEKCVGEKKR